MEFGEGSDLPLSEDWSSVGRFRFPLGRFYDPVHHLWAFAHGPRVRLGLDCLGEEVAGPLAFVQLRPVGVSMRAGEEFGSIESQKFVSALPSPLTGRIGSVNAHVLERPRLVNEDPFGRGWLIELEGTLSHEMQGLVHGGDPVRRYFSDAIASYRARGLLAEESERPDRESRR